MADENEETALTHLAVTYMMTPPDDSYARCGKVPTPAFVWAKSEADSDPITEVALLFDDEEAQKGFTKLEEDLNKGVSSQRVYLAYKTDAESEESKRIVAVAIASTEDPDPQSFTKLDKAITADSNGLKYFLWVKTKASGKGKGTRDFEVGDYVDVLDTVNKWCVARVQEREDDKVYVHYDGWSDKWNEWLKVTSHRIAIFRTHTRGRDTGPAENRVSYKLQGDNLKAFEEHVAKLEEVMEKKTWADEDLKFITNENMTFVQNILGAVIDNPEDVPKAANFLQRNLDLIVRHLKQNGEEVKQPYVDALVRIFNGDSRCGKFYSKYGLDPNKSKKSSGLFARKSKKQKDIVVSSYLIGNINYFGELGGFDAICDRLQDKKTTNFHVVKLFVRALATCRDFYPSKFIKAFVKKTKGPIFERIRTITDGDLKTLDREAINSIVEQYETLMLRAEMDPNVVAEFIEKFNLDMALRLITSKLLEKRINGMAELKATIERVIRKENPRLRNAQHGVARYLSSDYLLKWIEEYNVVDVLLGPTSHQELIKRSPPLLKFLAHHGALRNEHVDLLWQSSIGKHESLVRVVYDTIADLAQELSEEHLALLFSRLQAIPTKDHTDISLLFLRQFTINAVKNTRGKQFYGLVLFWELIQDGAASAVPLELATLARKTLVELLCMYEFASQKEHYLRLCLKNLQKGTSVPQTLLVAQKIIDTYPFESYRGQACLGDVIDELTGKHKLIELLLEDFQRYNKKASAEAKRVSADVKDPEELDAAVVVSRRSHKDHVNIRLDFLQFVFSNSEAHLSKEGVDALWTVFVEQAATPGDAGRLLLWLRDARDELRQQYFEALDEDVTEYIFHELLCKKMDFKSISRQGYKCFQTYFLHVNHNLSVLEKPTRNHPNRALQVNDTSHLVGVDPLWQIAAHAEDVDVSHLAAKFLIALHVLVYGSLDLKATFARFVEKAMGMLSTACAAINDGKDVEANKKIVSQLINLVDHFLYKVAQKEDSLADDARDQHQYLSKLTLRVIIYDADMKVDNQINVSLSPSNKIKQMRASLAKAMKWPGEQIQFVHRNRVLYPEIYDGKTVQEAQIKGPTDKIAAYKLSKEDAEKRPDPASNWSAYEHPRVLLANRKSYFSLLFDLLRIGGKVGQQVWRLLGRLPTNKELNENIDKLNPRNSKGAPDWIKILDPKSVLKLYYTLQLVSKHIQPVEEKKDAAAEPGGADGKEADTEETKKEVAENPWTNEFLDQGGFKHLYSVLLALDMQSVFEDALTQQCLSLLIGVFNHFLVSKELADRAAKFTAAMDFGRLVPLLMTCVDNAIKAKTTVEVADQVERKVTVGDGGDVEETEQKQKADGGRAQADLVTQALITLSTILGKNPKLIQLVYDYKGFSSIVQEGLLSHSSAGVRLALADGLNQLCVQFDGKDTRMKSPVQVLLPQLLEYLPKMDTESSAVTEYFQLITQLLSQSEEADSLVDADALSSQLLQKIQDHPIVETRAADRDVVLCGLLNLTKELVKKVHRLKPKLGASLVQQVFHDCLFAVPTSKARGVARPPKCKSRVARQSAFDLLVELARDCDENYQALAQRMTKNHFVTHTNGMNPKEWDFEAKAEEKSDTGFVGLKNLGCICYMNSFLQQLFMLPKLRQNLLSIDAKECEKDKPVEDNMIYQLQYILSFLQESERQYCNPGGFCHSFKDWDGNPTNVHVQMDTQEFLNMLFDRIDTAVKGSPNEKAVKDVLGGVYSNELICKGCPHYKEREEEFYAISLNVKNKTKLEESLEDFVRGEMLEGDNAYLCGVCKKKVDTLKRVCIKKLPKTLVFHLKRFEFNYDTMTKVKLNTRLEFPMELNIKPYCKVSMTDTKGKKNMEEEANKAKDDGKDSAGDDGKDAEDEQQEEEVDDADYEYELSGVLIHTGSADRGHYYSFIRERLSDEELATGLTPQWMEFNDAIVRPFDPADIPDECFGGEERRRVWSGSGGGAQGPVSYRHNQAGGSSATVTSEKFRNAYLLFYDRKPKATKTEDEKKQSKAVVPTLERQRSHTTLEVPKNIFKSIWDENITYWKDRAVFDIDYFRFVYSIVHMKNFQQFECKDLTDPNPNDTSFQVIELATRFVLATLSRSKHKETFGSWMQSLKTMYERHLPSCVWLLKMLVKDTSWAYDFLLDCRNGDVRRQVAGLLSSVMATVYAAEESKLPAYSDSVKLIADIKPEDDAKDSDKDKLIGDSYLLQFNYKLMGLLKDAPTHWRRFDNFFEVLAKFASLGAKPAHYMLAQSAVARLIDFYLGDHSPHKDWDIPVDAHGRRKKMTDDWGNKPNLQSFFELLSALVCSAKTQSKDATPPTLTADPAGAPELTAVDLDMLLCKPFLVSLLREATNRKRGLYVANIVCHWCFENEELTGTIVGYIADGIESLTCEDIRPYFRTLMPLVQVEDSLQAKRVHIVMSSLLGVMKLQNNYWKITQLCLEHLIRIAKKSDACREWLHANFGKAEWILQYLDAYPRQPAYNDPRVTTYKPDHRHKAQGWGPDRYYHEPSSLPVRDKIKVLHAIRDGKDIGTDFASDSDEDLADRVFEQGQWVDVKDTINNWCRATITAIRGDQLRIHYDGWSEKWDEWLVRASPRIARFGAWTDAIPEDKLKGNGPQKGDNLGNGRVYDPDAPREDDEDTEPETM